DALELGALDLLELRAGRRLAAAGLLGSITISAGRATAAVQDGPEVYQASLHADPLPESGWQQVTEALADKAAYFAALLDGELPSEVDGLLPSELEPECTCPG